MSDDLEKQPGLESELPKPLQPEVEEDIYAPTETELDEIEELLEVTAPARSFKARRQEQLDELRDPDLPSADSSDNKTSRKVDIENIEKFMAEVRGQIDDIRKISDSLYKAIKEKAEVFDNSDSINEKDIPLAIELIKDIDYLEKLKAENDQKINYLGEYLNSAITTSTGKILAEHGFEDTDQMRARLDAAYDASRDSHRLIREHYRGHPIRKLRKLFGREDEEVKDARRRILVNDAVSAKLHTDYMMLLEMRRAAHFGTDSYYYTLDMTKERLIRIVSDHIGIRLANTEYPDSSEIDESERISLSQEAKDRILQRLVVGKVNNCFADYNTQAKGEMTAELSSLIIDYLSQIEQTEDQSVRAKLKEEFERNTESICSRYGEPHLQYNMAHIPDQIADQAPIENAIYQGDQTRLVSIIDRQLAMADRFLTTTDYYSGRYLVESNLTEKKRDLERMRDNAMVGFLVDVESWNAFRADPEVIEKVGEEKLDQVESQMIQARMRKIVQCDDYRDNTAIKMEMELAKFHSVEALPMLTFYAFTQAGGSGERPLTNVWTANGRSVYDQYLADLDPEELRVYLSKDENTSLRKFIQNRRSRFGINKKDDEAYRRVQSKRFAELTGQLLHDASVEQRISMYAHLNGLGFEVDDSQAEMIEMALREPHLAKKFLENCLTAENCKYAKEIFQTAPESEYLSYIGHMSSRMTMENYDAADLSFIAPIVEKMLEDESFLGKLSANQREDILRLLSYIPNQDTFGKFYRAVVDDNDNIPFAHTNVVKSLATAFLHGDAKALEYLEEIYEKDDSDKYNMLIANGVSEVIGGYLLTTRLENVEETAKRKEFIEHHLGLLESDDLQKRRFAAVMLNDIFRSSCENLNPEAQQKVDAVFLDQATELHSFLDRDPDVVTQLILLDNQIRKIQNRDERAELTADFITRMRGAAPELADAWGLVNPLNELRAVQREKIPQEKLDEMLKVFLENMQESQAAIGIVVEEYYAGRLNADNTRLLEGSTLPDYDFSKNPPVPNQPVTKENWVIYLAGFINSMGGQQQVWIEEAFKDPEVMNLVFEQYRLAYLDHISKMTESKANIDAVLIARLINENEGAGHLRHIQAMAGLVEGMDSAFAKGRSSDATKRQLGQMLIDQESYFDKNRWGNEDRSYFYNVTKEIVGAAPSLYQDFDRLFKLLNPKEFRDFVENVYPLFQAQLVVIEKRKPPKNPGFGMVGALLPKEAKEYNSRDLLPIRKMLQGFAERIESGENTAQVVEELKTETLSVLQTSFKERLGFDKLPETLAGQDIRALKDILVYMGNMKDKNDQKTDLLIFYLALTVNGKWEDFRSGKMFRGENLDSDLSEYFDVSSPQFMRLKEYLADRDKTVFIPSEVIGLTDAEIVEIQPILQSEVVVQHLGNVRTVDDKLESIVLGLDVYKDPDTYPEQMRPFIPLIEKFGSGQVNTSLGKRIQNEMGKNIPISEEEMEITEKLLEVAGLDPGMPIIDRLKNIQSAIKLGTVSFNLVEKQKEYRKLVGDLRAKLVPGAEIIRIFNSIGEEFKTDSGAQAISQDLIFLESVASKNQDKITEQADKDAIANYLGEIRELMSVLEKAILEIENKLKLLLEESKKQGADLYQTSTAEMLRNLRGTDSALTINSTATNRWVPIIENMRQCLACNTTGCNNDTNLTFGDPNKFYLYSQDANKEASEGSISDEIVFFEPITVGDQVEMSFVFDQIYGNHSPDILYGHLAAITKKLAAIKAKAPQARISIFITGSAMLSSGLSNEVMTKRFGSAESAYIIEPATAEVNVIESPGGDHYVEFGGGARTSGKRSVAGLRIRMRS